MCTHCSENKPFIFENGVYSLSDIKAFQDTHPNVRVHDVYFLQYRELLRIEHPGWSKEKLKEESGLVTAQYAHDEAGLQGNWVYFPWRNLIVHTVGKTEYRILRTNRNRELVRQDEQAQLFLSVVAVAGLSIGSSITRTLVQNGIAGTVKLADSDTIDTTNLNRIAAGLQDVGAQKSSVLSQALYELDPYLSIVLFDEGLNEGNLNDFILGDPAPRVVFDAIDDLKMKMRLRVAAREAGVPVVMITNLGDNVLLDVERFDEDRTLPLFNGRIGNVPEEILSAVLTKDNEQHYVRQIVGAENVPDRAKESVMAIGTTLVGRPQLAGTLSVGSGIAAYVAREILLGGAVPSGRRLVSFKDTFLPSRT